MSRAALVIDASIALTMATSTRQPPGIERHRLVAPRLLWSEALAAMRQQAWRGVLPAGAAGEARARLEDLAIEPFEGREIRERAWQVAERLGWAKTFAAEYVALADILDAPLLTGDERLFRGVGQIVRVLRPTDL